LTASPQKQLLAVFLDQMADATNIAQARNILTAHCHDDCHWEIFHPFNTLHGTGAALEQFWGPLHAALPDREYRRAFMVSGNYEGRDLVSSWGHIMGTFDQSLVGIPATHGLAFLRFGINAVITDGRFSKVYILLDLVDLMRQAGVYPLRRMPGTAELWPFPPSDTGASEQTTDLDRGARTMQIVHEMQMGLPKPDEIASLSSKPSRHSHHWHPKMNWYGPAGIGAMRGQRGFRDFHGALFLQAFPDRHGFPRAEGCPENAPGHYIRLGDGHYAVTSGWPSVVGTHLGPEWLGLPPTGRAIEMRVADWYRLDAGGLIVDNWVMMDIPHILMQMGLDILHDLEFVVDPERERWPLT
jgi:SnoaL-like domain